LQATIPVGEYNNVPVAVSLLAKRGSDKFLLDTVLAFYPTIQEEANAASDRSSAGAAEQAKEKVWNHCPVTLNFIGLIGIAC
jgi:hypothetical protein